MPRRAAGAGHEAPRRPLERTSRLPWSPSSFRNGWPGVTRGCWIPTSLRSRAYDPAEPLATTDAHRKRLHTPKPVKVPKPLQAHREACHRDRAARRHPQVEAVALRSVLIPSLPLLLPLPPFLYLLLEIVDFLVGLLEFRAALHHRAENAHQRQAAGDEPPPPAK